MMFFGSVGVDPASATAAQAQEESAAAQGVRASSARARRLWGGFWVAAPRRRCIALCSWGSQIAHVCTRVLELLLQRWRLDDSYSVLAPPSLDLGRCGL